MKLSELMKDYTPSESYEGWVTNDDYVFAIDTAPNGSTATKEGDYVVVEMGIAGLDAQLNPITKDKTYIRAGQNTMKTGTQRAFSVTGDRYVGDEAQDYCLSHKTKYGTGKVGKLSDGTTVVARPGSTTGGATLEIRVFNRKVYKIRY